MKAGLAVALALAACAPSVDGPVERQRAADHADAARLQTQLAALSGATQAVVVLHRPIADPLAAPAPAAPASLSAVIEIDDGADAAAITRDATALLRTTSLEPTLVVAVTSHRPTLAKVGPFTVAASSRNALRATLVIALALVASLAAAIAWRTRRAPL